MNPAHYKPISVDLTQGRPCAFQNPFPEFWNGVQTCDAALQAQPPKHFGPRSIPPDKRDGNYPLTTSKPSDRVLIVRRRYGPHRSSKQDSNLHSHRHGQQTVRALQIYGLHS